MIYNRRTRRIINASREKSCAFQQNNDSDIRVSKELDGYVYRNAYEDNSEYNVDWRKYADHIFIVRTEEKNEESDKRITQYGIPREIISIVPIDYKSLYKSCKDPLGSALMSCVAKSYESRYGRVLILTDDFYLTGMENTEKALEESLSFDICLLNPGDITRDCVSLSLKSVDFISNIKPDMSKKGWFNTVVSSIMVNNGLKNGCSIVPMLVHAIDYMFPYVDSSDEKWIELYTKHTGNEKDKKANRFRSYDALQYHLRGIEKFMPFVRKVHLILQSESQVPVWLNTDNINVVYHRDFIPEKFLPTFNSCTIESFLYNIKGVSEHVIYANDDFFPINTMNPSEFFVNGIPQFITKGAYGTSTYRRQCRNSYMMAIKEFGIPRTEEFRKPSHISTPMLRRCVLHIGHVYVQDISDSITILRNAKNINQYVYSLYQKALTGGGDMNVSYLYSDFSDGASKICKAIEGGEYKIICINDAKAGDNFDKITKLIRYSFDKKLHGKSRFEK